VRIGKMLTAKQTGLERSGVGKMVALLSQMLDTAQPAEALEGAPACLDIIPDTTFRHDIQAVHLRNILDLRKNTGLARLQYMNSLWPELSVTEKRHWLDRTEIMLPPCLVSKPEIALLPGGAVALRNPTETLVCDPVEAAVFNQAEVKQLRRLLRGRADITTLLHVNGGVTLHRRFPKQLPPQAVSIVPNAGKLPFRLGFSGPALIQWGHHGAVARPLIEVSGLLALAVSLGAAPRQGGEPGLVRGGSLIIAEAWRAVEAEDRCRLIGVAVMEHCSDLVADTVCDDLRYGLMEACVEGPDSLAARIAKGLAVLPTCFAADPEAFPGMPPPVWRRAMAQIREAPHPRALLGIDNLVDPLAATRSLRDSLEHAEVVAFDADGDTVLGGPVALHSDAALFLARKAGPLGRLAVAIPTPATPLELYALTHEVALVSQARIIAVAEAWGFCHRIEPDGEEAGNAGWFGMGVGLDEVDDLVGDIDLDA
jgi:hypothetical protein